MDHVWISGRRRQWGSLAADAMQGQPSQELVLLVPVCLWCVCYSLVTLRFGKLLTSAVVVTLLIEINYLNKALEICELRIFIVPQRQSFVTSIDRLQQLSRLCQRLYRSSQHCHGGSRIFRHVCESADPSERGILNESIANQWQTTCVLITSCVATLKLLLYFFLTSRKDADVSASSCTKDSKHPPSLSSPWSWASLLSASVSPCCRCPKSIQRTSTSTEDPQCSCKPLDNQTRTRRRRRKSLSTKIRVWTL